MHCSFPALTPKAHRLVEESGNFYVYVDGEATETETERVDENAFGIYVRDLAADWGITLHHSHPSPSLDRRSLVMRGHVNGFPTLVVFLSACRAA